MEDTCMKEKCFFWDMFDGNCPMYIQLTFEDAKTKEVRHTEDCAPKRIVLMLADMYGRLEGLQKVTGSLRNESAWVQVVAEVLGKNSGVDLSAFVHKRQQLLNLAKLKQEQEVKELEDQKRGIGTPGNEPDTEDPLRSEEHPH